MPRTGKHHPVYRDFVCALPPLRQNSDGLVISVQHVVVMVRERRVEVCRISPLVKTFKKRRGVVEICRLGRGIVGRNRDIGTVRRRYGVRLVRNANPIARAEA